MTEFVLHPDGSVRQNGKTVGYIEYVEHGESAGQTFVRFYSSEVLGHSASCNFIAYGKDWCVQNRSAQ